MTDLINAWKAVNKTGNKIDFFLYVIDAHIVRKEFILCTNFFEFYRELDSTISFKPRFNPSWALI